MHHIAIAESEADIDRGFPIMHELRPHLIPSDFSQQVRRQEQNCYRLVDLNDRVVRALRVFGCWNALPLADFCTSMT